MRGRYVGGDRIRRPSGILRPAIASLALLLSPAAAFCASAAAPAPDGWSGKGQAGGVTSQGNTQSTTFNAVLDLALVAGPWKHALHLDGLYGRNAGITSSERWGSRWQSDYTFRPAVYAFGILRYERDLFSGFDYQASAAAGVGYRILDTDRVKLSVQAGPGFRREQPQTLSKDAAGAVIARSLGTPMNSAILSAGIDYSQVLTATTTLSDKLLTESGGGNTLVTNALALAVKVSTHLALSVGYSIQNNSSPPPGLKRLDSNETVNLVYSF